MSELRHRYDRTAVSDRITQPPFADLAERGRRRAHRTRTVRLAGVAGFATLVAAPLLALPGGHQPDPPAGSGPPGSERAWQRHEITVSFLDLNHGVAHYQGDTCREGWISVTRDGGTTWSELREQPGVPDQDSGAETDNEPACVRPVVTPVAPDTLLMPGPPPPSVLPDRPSFISHDGGRTWQEYEPQVRVADSVPDGVTPGWPCDEEECKAAGLGWHDPRTGDWMRLENNPPGVDYDGLTVGDDGSIWVYGSPGRSGDFHLSVSRDRGRSWLDRSLDPNTDLDPNPDPDWLADALFRAQDGDTAYLYPTRYRYPTRYNQKPDLFERYRTTDADSFELYRTTDGGETWHQMPAAQQFADVVGVWTTRDGGLVLDLVGDQYLTTDGGETFARAELPVWGVRELPGGGLQGWPRDRSAADLGDLYLSEDGQTWQPVEVPYYPGPADAPTSSPSPGR